MKKILLTGGLGYIGSYFFDNFKNNYDIKIFDNNLFQKNLTKDLNLIQKDIRDIEKKDLENYEIIIHMGELSNDPLGQLNEKLTNLINHEATINLLKLANKTSIKKFIYMSSASVYGFTKKIVDENSITNPLTAYSKAKIENEQFILKNNFTFESIILRNSTAFGYSSNLRLDLVVNDLTYSGFKNKEIKLQSDGSPKRPLVHIHDICYLIDLLINDERNLNNEIFNVGSEEMNFSVKEIAKTVQHVLNINKVSLGEYDPDQRSYEVSFKKLYKFFPNYKIKYNLQKGIEDLVKNLELHNIKNNEYRINYLKKLLIEKKINENLYWLK